MSEVVRFFFDGGGSHDGSPAGWGWVCLVNGQEYAHGSHGLRPGTTNNVAEYEALIRAAEYACVHDFRFEATFEFYGDSLLVVNQVNGEWQVRKPTLREQHERALQTLEPLDYTLAWIPRAENARADMLATQGRGNYLAYKQGARSIPR